MAGPYRARTAKGNGRDALPSPHKNPHIRRARPYPEGMHECSAAFASSLRFLLVPAAMSPACAADEPDLIFKRSTVFKWLSPNDKLATYGLDDPEVDGVACHFTVPEKGGFKGWIGVAEEVSDISLACRQIGPIRFKAKFEQGDDVFRQRRSLFFKKMQIVRGCDVKRNVLVYWSIPTASSKARRRIRPRRCGHAVGPERSDSKMRGFRREVTARRRRPQPPFPHRATPPIFAAMAKSPNPPRDPAKHAKKDPGRPTRSKAHGRTPRRPIRRWSGCSTPASRRAPPAWAREPA